AFYRRNYRRPTAIFLGQPVAFPSSVGSNHYPRATTAPVSRSACSSTPAVWERSNDEAAWGNRPLRKNSNRPFARVSLTPRGYVPGARQSCPLLLLFQQSACRTWPESPDHWFSVFRPPKTL